MPSLPSADADGHLAHRVSIGVGAVLLTFGTILLIYYGWA